jgi:hypothetical protein
MRIFDEIKKLGKTDAYSKEYEKRAHRYKEEGWREHYVDVTNEKEVSNYGEQKGLAPSRAKQLAKFMKLRFGDRKMVDKYYTDDWVRRFHGDPVPFMDKESKEAYKKTMR